MESILKTNEVLAGIIIEIEKSMDIALAKLSYKKENEKENTNISERVRNSIDQDYYLEQLERTIFNNKLLSSKAILNRRNGFLEMPIVFSVYDDSLESLGLAIDINPERKFSTSLIKKIKNTPITLDYKFQHYNEFDDLVITLDGFENFYHHVVIYPNNKMIIQKPSINISGFSSFNKRITVEEIALNESYLKKINKFIDIFYNLSNNFESSIVPQEIVDIFFNGNILNNELIDTLSIAYDLDLSIAKEFSDFFLDTKKITNTNIKQKNKTIKIT